jgi:hypothetical protein
VFRRKPKTTSTNSEVQEAMRDRDVLMEGVAKAVKKVDVLQNELLRQYFEAERKLKAERAERKTDGTH